MSRLALAAGAIADAFDRRLLIVSQLASVACCLVLALLSAAGRPPLAVLQDLAGLPNQG